jgi:ElaB/YqjD/DUF883 family membrane-anchored ribosome-binding protein
VITAPLVAAAHSAVVAAEEVEEVNPLLPHTYDIVWSLVIVVIIAVVFIKYALPKFQAVLDERAELIEGGLKHAETAQAEAAELRAEYEQQLADARTEAARIKEAARAEGGAIVTELKAKATAEDPWAQAWLKENTAGSGAYTIESFKPGETTILRRNPAWDRGSPEKPALRARGSSASTQSAALRWSRATSTMACGCCSKNTWSRQRFVSSWTRCIADHSSRAGIPIKVRRAWRGS